MQIDILKICIHTSFGFKLDYCIDENCTIYITKITDSVVVYVYILSGYMFSHAPGGVLNFGLGRDVRCKAPNMGAC